jgi:hypothetical protein
MKKAGSEELLVLDPRRLPSLPIRSMLRMFDGLVVAEFERLPGMANCQASRPWTTVFPESWDCQAWGHSTAYWPRSR